MEPQPPQQPPQPPQQPPQPQRVKFVPFSSAIESPFWVQYNRLKLETIRLSTDPLPITATYSVTPPPASAAAASDQQSQPHHHQCRLQCHESSLNDLSQQQEETSPDYGAATTRATIANERVHVQGVLLGFNTVESFQKADKNALLRQHFCQAFFNAQRDDQVALNALNSFVVLTYADLKQHQVVYWFGFPALLLVQNKQRPLVYTSPPQPLAATFPDREQRLSLAQQVATMRAKQLSEAFSSASSSSSHAGLPPYYVWSPGQQVCVPLSVANVRTLQKDNDTTSLIFAFFDPACVGNDPGWPLRNMLAYLAFYLRLGGQTVSILCYRPGRLRRLANPSSEASAVSSNNKTTDLELVEMDHVHDASLVFRLVVPTPQDYGHDDSTDTMPSSFDTFQAAGWELNARGKPGPRSVHLKPLLDPQHLAIQAADLNLKLMKWRMLPNLQVERLQKSRILLLGAGTLGCNVARTLLGWGVRNITFVDNGRVGYSNPVRQPLFTLDDCRGGGGNSGSGEGKFKAVAAADALQSIAADVEAKGVVLSIPMPGHAESKQVIEDTVTQLDQLIRDCDAVFLLTDTRESRWLPTVLAAAHDKLLINAALGLDSWLVMRHGNNFDRSSNEEEEEEKTSDDKTPNQKSAAKFNNLGCYFCNDVVAPENSTKNRTLDQQCTVTRPGLAPIASSLAVELFVALQHCGSGATRAPAPPRHVLNSNFSPTVAGANTDKAEEEAVSSTTALGVLPHQIRGSIVTYTVMTPTVPAFEHCTGCAPAIVHSYRRSPTGLVYQACQPSGATYLEDLAGLTEFRAQATAAMENDDLLMMMEEDEDDDDAL